MVVGVEQKSWYDAIFLFPAIYRFLPHFASSSPNFSLVPTLRLICASFALDGQIILELLVRRFLFQFCSVLSLPTTMTIQNFPVHLSSPPSSSAVSRPILSPSPTHRDPER
jgi:hypothetical protein